MTTTDLAEQVQAWLCDAYRANVAVELSPTAAGRVNDTMVAAVRFPDGRRESIVVKRPATDGAVFRADPSVETRYLKALHAGGANVPEIRFTDDGRYLGSPGFAMEYLPGRAVADDMLTGHLAEGWFAEVNPSEQQSIWSQFHDTLADVHRLDPHVLGLSDQANPLTYWRHALGAVTDRKDAPIQHEVLDWLADRRPPEASERTAVCMGDARLANAIFGDGRVHLVDWELAHLGHPAADIAYSLRMDDFFSTNAGTRASGIPHPEQTWQSWEERSGWRTDHRDYWAVHAGIVIAVTATRAITELMRSAENPHPVPPEEFNPFVTALGALIAKADR